MGDPASRWLLTVGDLKGIALVALLGCGSAGPTATGASSPMPGRPPPTPLPRVQVVPRTEAEQALLDRECHRSWMEWKQANRIEVSTMRIRGGLRVETPASSAPDAVLTVRGRFRVLSGEQRVPEMPCRWEIGFYDGVARFYAAAEVSVAPGALLRAGDLYGFEARVPMWRVLLYVDESRSFDIQGPFYRGANPSVIGIDRIEYVVVEPPELASRWSRPRVADQGRYGRAGVDYEAGTVLVGFKEDTRLPRIEHEVRRLEGRIDGCHALDPAHYCSIRYPPDQTIEEAIDALKLLPIVRYAEPNVIMRFSM